MIEIYSKIKAQAQFIASQFPEPNFYNDLSWAADISNNVFYNDSIIRNLINFTEPQLAYNKGHGMLHATKVAIDAGSLIATEGKLVNYSESYILRQIVCAQCAGILHDTKRKEKDHALKGAVLAKKILRNHPFSSQEIDNICIAIRNHEAFKSTIESVSSEGLLISNCLYDADKFRWGPDNFTDTIWEMALYANIQPKDFIKMYPKGMDTILKIKSTFRSNTGKKYGPQFIEIGIKIGKALYEFIISQF
ncbi:MAG: hypothetical protein HQK76_04860 [Desulfobacterales bacterium]|nr:hypothetical protein [Desulfobacterales bacterium]